MPDPLTLDRAYTNSNRRPVQAQQLSTTLPHITYIGEMANHDSSYKHFFSHKRMVKDLLQGYLKESRVAELDFDSLEKLDTTLITDQQQRREADVIWRLKFQDRWLYVYLLLEFQSKPDPWMAVRMLVYSGLLYQSLIRQGQLKTGAPLPPVLPIVLYNGSRAWQAATDLQSLQAPQPEELKHYQPSISYWLVDEKQYTDGQLGNVVSAVFALESSPDLEKMQAVVTQLVDWLHSDTAPNSEEASLQRALLQWISATLSKKAPQAQQLDLSNLREAKLMLAERAEQWKAEYRQEGLKQGQELGIQKGLEQGLEQGRKQGQEQGVLKGMAKLFSKQAELKFGALPPEVVTNIQQADEATLTLWAERLLSANSLSELFEH